MLGWVLRLYDLGDPPLDFHPTRQLHSALISRGMYYEQSANAPDWQRKMAVSQWRAEGVIEPQVTERLVAWIYGLVGSADLRVPRLYAIFFWMVAAGFVLSVAVQIAGWGGALVGAFFFLIWPYGVIASRAFQPEPLMIALMAGAIWAGLRWEQRGGWGWALATGLAAGLSIYIKSVALFFVAPALVVLVVAHDRCAFRKLFKDPQVWAMAALSCLPYLFYLLDGVFWNGYLVGQFSMRFFPQMWSDPAFYLRWISNLGRAVPFEMVLVAILGIFLARRPVDRALLAAMWAGYFLYGMTLSHHISTHDYYHLPLFLVVALGLAAVAETLFNGLRGSTGLVRLAAVGLLSAALVITSYDARTTLKRGDMAAQAAVWEGVGQALGPGASVVALVPDYGAGLEYYAWITPAVWPTVNDIEFRVENGQNQNFNNLFDSQVSGRDFFVITLFDDLDQQPALKAILTEQYPIYRQAPGYIIYDLRSPKNG